MKPTSIKILLILSIASFGYFGLSISSFSPIEREAGYLISKVCNTLFALGFIILLGVFIKKYSVHDKFHRTLILSGFCLLKIAKISLNSSFFPKPIKR
uniref:Uncharacterized protein n=1 Tax=Acinetobacter baumannii TaxID=470 RepID=C7FEK5_ACIBA|nr:hypothetical protein [Acinetobacter baumannii]